MLPLAACHAQPALDRPGAARPPDARGHGCVRRPRLGGGPALGRRRAGGVLGHFILHVGGESLLADLGAGLYTREYFGPQRYEHIHNSSAGHSVPLIEGQAQQAGRAFSASVLQREVRPDGVLFVIDLKNAYAAANLHRFVRSFRWVVSPARDQAQLVLTDTFAFGAAPSALEEIFISLHEPALAPGRVTWRGVRGAVTLAYHAGRLHAAAEAIASRDHFDQPIVVHRLRLAATQPRAEEEFVFTFEVSQRRS